MSIVEDGFDFWSELEKETVTEINDSTCLLSKETLTMNHIILPCGHKFNYIPLCKEIASLKYPKSVYARTINLTRLQTCCPYCRKIFDKLLPKIPLYVMSLPKYVCSENDTLSSKQCMYIAKSGKHKDKPCDKMCGFDTNYGVLCSNHYRRTIKSSEQFENSSIKQMFDNNTVISLKKQLKDLHLSLSGCKRDLVNRLAQHADPL
jgi:benzoyl-CoA reductase/2-hydroxyglutaryl-CoA dehydratase subunit BcrC/BadD/HgdB